ncbi:unnamed protein product [Camellia sinensis]
MQPRSHPNPKPTSHQTKASFFFLLFDFISWIITSFIAKYQYQNTIFFDSGSCQIPTTQTCRRLYHLCCANMASSTSLYEVLGIPMNATGNEIKAAYRKLARTCHPDVAMVNRRDKSANEFMKIHAAYSTLSDPDKRAVYDRDLFRLRHRFGSSSATLAAMATATSMSEFSGHYPRRNWESDQCW